MKIEGLNNTTLSIKVLSISGKMVYQDDQIRVTGTYNNRLDLSHLAEGVYSVFVSSNGNIANKKLIVRR